MNLKDSLLRVRLFLLQRIFPGSSNFWIKVYKNGGNSGPGSYGKLANFKAEFLNSFIEKNEIDSIIEFGCGDGNQISLGRYKSYLGFDIAPEAISLCIKKFSNDASKSFLLYQPEYFKPGGKIAADLTLSLDVIYHLVELEKFEVHLRQLFESSNKWVIIYGYDSDSFFPEPYSKPRKFTEWIARQLPEWSLESIVKNKYPLGGGSISTWADFYVFKKIAS